MKNSHRLSTEQPGGTAQLNLQDQTTRKRELRPIEPLLASTGSTVAKLVVLRPPNGAVELSAWLRLIQQWIGCWRAWRRSLIQPAGTVAKPL